MTRPTYTVRLYEGKKVVIAETRRRVDAARLEAFKAYRKATDKAPLPVRVEWNVLNRLSGYMPEMEKMEITVGKFTIEVSSVLH